MPIFALPLVYADGGIHAGFPSPAQDYVDGIDRSLEAHNDSIAVCCLNNEFTIKRIDLTNKDKGFIRLVPDNPSYEPITVTEDDEFIMWGVVRYVIHKTV